MSTETREATYTPWWAFALTILAGLGLIAAFVSSASRSPLIRNGAQTVVSGEGVAVQDGNLEYSVLDVNTGVSSIGDPVFGTSPTSGSFAIVTVSVRNIGTSPATFDSSYVLAVTPSGDRLPSDREASYYADAVATTPHATLQPGERITTAIAFAVPAHTSLTGVQVHDSVFSRGAVIAFKDSNRGS